MNPILLAALIAVSGVGRAADRKAHEPRDPAAGQPEAPPAELSDADLRGQIGAFLGSIDTPIPAAHWRGLGLRAAPILSALISDAAQFPTQRAKAIDGLSALRPASAPALFGKLASSEEEPLVVRLAALRGLGEVVPARRLPAALLPLLEGAKEPAVRAGAAEVLVARAGACGSLHAQLARETEEVRGMFHRSVAGCAERAKASTAKKASKR